VMLAGHLTTMVTAMKRESLNFVWIPMMFSLSSIACSHMVMDLRISGATPPPSQVTDPGSAGFNFAVPLKELMLASVGDVAPGSGSSGSSTVVGDEKDDLDRRRTGDLVLT